MILKRFRILTFLAAAAIFAGCSETPQYKGAAVDTDQNVLTGGPITGTTIEELPTTVKETLKQRSPHAEIASIGKLRRNGTVIYEISFLNSDDPDLYVADDGKPLPEFANAQK